MRQILFIQGGGGHDVHDTWDNKLLDSLNRELGEGYDVRYPRMPDEDDPRYAKWKPVIREELERLPDGSVVVGHSIGGTMLINVLETFGAASVQPLMALMTNERWQVREQAADAA